IGGEPNEGKGRNPTLALGGRPLTPLRRTAGNHIEDKVPSFDRDRRGESMHCLIFGLLAGLLCSAFGAPASAQDAASFKLLKLAGNNVHWQAPANGQALVVTYMLVRDDVEFASARNCRKMTSFDHLIAASELAPSMVGEEIVAAFDMWAAAARI